MTDKNAAPSYGARRDHDPYFYWLARLVVGGFVTIIVFPILYIFSLSFRTPETAGKAFLFLIPHEVTLYNYVDAFDYASTRLGVSLPRLFWNSTFVTVMAVSLIVSFSIFAAYSFSFHKFRFKESLYTFMLASFAIPAQVLLIPLFYILRELGILNTYAALVLPYIAFLIPIGVLILRTFYEQIPREIMESGIIDGAGDFQLLTRIILPIAKPAVATCVILLFLDTWNEFIFALVFIQDPTIQTIPVALAKIAGSRYSIPVGTYAAAIVITVLPVLAVFVLFQKWFIAGITMGALKH